LLLLAEQAHVLYNGTTFEDGSRLHLYFTEDGQEPEPSAIVLQVKNLAPDVTSKDIYCLFRTFGPLGFCTVVSDEPNVDIRGSGLVQFYEQDDADAAASELVCKHHTLIYILRTFFLTTFPSAPKKYFVMLPAWKRTPWNDIVSHLSLKITNDICRPRMVIFCFAGLFMLWCQQLCKYLLTQPFKLMKTQT
jgi:RNA recognition motif-containing protein